MKTQTIRGFTSTSEKDSESLLSLFSSAVEAKPRRGFTLLLAVLVSGILLALGFAIFNIVSKEVILSSSGRESQFAFYAADTGVECALYWDYQADAFSAESTDIPACGGLDLNTYEKTDDGFGNITTTFSFSLGDAVNYPCADVEVLKEADTLVTTIIASGFNTCVITNPRRLERTIQVQY